MFQPNIEKAIIPRIRKRKRPHLLQLLLRRLPQLKNNDQICLLPLHPHTTSSPSCSTSCCLKRKLLQLLVMLEQFTKKNSTWFEYDNIDFESVRYKKFQCYFSSIVVLQSKERSLTERHRHPTSSFLGFLFNFVLLST